MRRSVRRFFLFLGLLIAFTVVKFPYDSFSPEVKQRLREESQKAGILWDSQDFRFDIPPQIEARQISGFIKTSNFPVPFVIDSLQGHLPVWSLLKLAPSVLAQATLYGGSCQGAITPMAGGGFKTANLNCEQLNLELHPSLDFLGVQGRLSAQVTAQSIDKASVSLHLRQGAIKDPKKLSPFAPPVVEKVDLDCEAELAEHRAQITSLVLNSPLGNATARGLLVSNDRGFLANQTAFSAEIRLSESGQQSIGPYLALAASLPIDTKSASWQIQVSGSGGPIPNIKVTPVR